jgi:hypothetical protein
MLTALALDNFKGVAVRQRVEFAPVTLLFGANSAGKSTILHALAYVHELLARGDADLDHTFLGGDVLELGGFARLAHQHDTSKAMHFRLEFQTSIVLNRSLRPLDGLPFADLDDTVKAAWIELVIESRLTTTWSGPLLVRALVGIGAHPEPLVQLELGPSLRDGEPLYVRVNLGHDVWAEHYVDVVERWTTVALPAATLEPVYMKDRGPNEPTPIGILPSLEGPHPHDQRALPVFAISRSRPSAMPALDEPIRVLMPGGDDPTPEQAATLDEIRTFLEMIVQGTTAQLVAHLEQAAYLGPLRAVPPRGFLYERAGRSVRWADGLAAWDLLLADRGRLVKDTNARPARLEAGCQLVVQNLVDTAGQLRRPRSRRRRHPPAVLGNDDGGLALPSEVGAGIAQVLPVIVAALADRVPFVMIEQPEIHVHPRLQTGLGDLFIEASASRQLLIETHSEHLILRLLRRIRETTDGELAAGAPAFTPDQLSVMHVQSTPAGRRLHAPPGRRHRRVHRPLADRLLRRARRGAVLMAVP